MGLPNTSPIYTGSIIDAAVTLATANTNRDGTGTLGTVYAATAAASGGNGARIDRIRIQAQGTTTAGVIRLFHYDGSAYFLLEEVLVSAVTPSTSIEAWSTDLVRSDGLPYVQLAAGHSLKASTHNAEDFTVIAFGGAY